MTLQFVDKVDLEELAHTLVDKIDWTPIHNLGWTGMSMRLMGYTRDGIPLNVIAYYDSELGKTVVRHE